MKNEGFHRLRLWLFGCLTAAIMGMIFWFSAQNALLSQQMSDGFLSSLIGSILEKLLPGLTGQGMAVDIRKYAHMAEFFCLGISAFLFLSELRRWRQDLTAALMAFCFSVLYACTDEVHQIFVPGRAGRFTDVLVDSVGIALGVSLCALCQQVFGRKSNDNT